MSQSLLHQVTYSDKVIIFIIAPSNSNVSIPFTSGHVFRLKGRALRRILGMPVSIPFTSGHVFRRGNITIVEGGLLECLNPFYIRSRIPTEKNGSFSNPGGMSQSLLHQVTYSDLIRGNQEVAEAMVSQSLLHQVTYSDDRFSFNEGVDYGMSQSLLHQVTYSDSISPNILKRTISWSQSLLHQVTYSDLGGPESKARR